MGEVLQHGHGKNKSAPTPGPAPAIQGEGNLLPQEITGIATKAGSKHYVIQAVDAISQEEVKGIEPLDIELEVEE
jgi:hypothetical protein